MREKLMTGWPPVLMVLGIILVIAVACSQPNPLAEKIPWKVSDRNRPLPPVVTPGTESTPDQPGKPPSDAIVLFDGKDLSSWASVKGGLAKWALREGHMETGDNAGDIVTRQAFGDCQLHVEWATPSPPTGKDQEPGNSGVYLMSLYEIQILDSYENTTYADGQAAAIYAQYPPLVNACRPPGRWQSFDVVFHGPRFDKDGKLLRTARITLFHNGVLVQDRAELTGPTDYMKRPPYRPHPEKMPLLLQDHGKPVKFRNIWIREIPENAS